jgi:hypothetical protein
MSQKIKTTFKQTSWISNQELRIGFISFLFCIFIPGYVLVCSRIVIRKITAMERIIKRISTPEKLNANWNKLADFYFQKKEFLTHLHKYNPCTQRYYELYCNNKFVAGTVVYTLKVDIFTFANIPSPFKFQIIGLPASIATPPMIGDSGEFEYFLSELIQLESGLILGINFLEDHLQNKVLNMRTLPTFILNLECDKVESYENTLRHSYRRRIHKIRNKFTGITSVTSDCSLFNEEHYDLYLEIMKKTKTKLETLSFKLFRYLPPNFLLTTYYDDKKMLCWHIICKDINVLFFFFGGMNYLYRDQFQSYNNNLLGIIGAAYDYKYNMIDFGQTAEVAKTRLGATLSERRMFVYHKNPLISGLLKLLRNIMSYSTTNEKCHVFKGNNSLII